MKKTIAVLLVLTLMVSLLAACGQKYITSEKAEKIALKEMGVTGDEVDATHVHVAETADGPAYSIHVEYEGQTYEYVILAENGKILSSGTVHGH